MNLDDRNYYNDHRVQAGERAKWYKSIDARRMVAIVLVNYVDEQDGLETEEECEVPFKFEVCPTCDGKGTHTNPSVDSGGITGSEWAEWDDEDRESYMEGTYDVQCYECRGQRVTPEMDRERVDPKILEHMDRAAREEAEFRAIERAERMMGA